MKNLPTMNSISMTTTKPTNTTSPPTMNSTYLDTIHRFRTLCLQVPHLLTQCDVNLIESTSNQLQLYLTELKQFHTTTTTSTTTATEKGLRSNGSALAQVSSSLMLPHPIGLKSIQSSSETHLVQLSSSLEKDNENENEMKKNTTLPLIIQSIPFLLDPSSSSTHLTTPTATNSPLRFRSISPTQLQISFSNVFVLDGFIHPETHCLTDLEIHSLIPSSSSSSTATTTTTIANTNSSSSSSSSFASTSVVKSNSSHSMSYVIRRLEHLFHHDLIGQSIGSCLLYLHPYQQLYHSPCQQCHRILKNEGVGPYADLVPPLIRWLPPLKKKITCLHESCVEVTKE